MISRKCLRKDGIKAWLRENFKKKLKWQFSARDLRKKLSGRQIPFTRPGTSFDVTNNYIFDASHVFASEQDVLSKSNAGWPHPSSSLKLRVGVFRCHLPAIGTWLWFANSGKWLQSPAGWFLAQDTSTVIVPTCHISRMCCDRKQFCCIRSVIHKTVSAFVKCHSRVDAVSRAGLTWWPPLSSNSAGFGGGIVSFEGRCFLWE